MSHLGQERSYDRTERGTVSAEAIPLCPCRLRDCSFIVVLTVQVAQPFIDVCFCFVVSLSFALLYNPVELKIDIMPPDIQFLHSKLSPNLIRMTTAE